MTLEIKVADGIEIRDSNPSGASTMPSQHLPLKVPNVKFNFDVSVRHCLLSTHTLKSNSTLGTHLYAMIRTHHFDFDIRF